MDTVEVRIKVKPEQLIPLMNKLGVEEWSFKKDHVDVDMTMTKLVDRAMGELPKNQDLI